MISGTLLTRDDGLFLVCLLLTYFLMFPGVVLLQIQIMLMAIDPPSLESSGRRGKQHLIISNVFSCAICGSCVCLGKSPQRSLQDQISVSDFIMETLEMEIGFFPFYEINSFTRHDAGWRKGGLQFLKVYIYCFEDGRC